MQGQSIPHTQFGRNLRAELNDQNVSVRELARRMQPGNPEPMRRSIFRWLSPSPGAPTPSPASVQSVAEALGVPVESLSPESDEEESVSDLLIKLAARMGALEKGRA